MAILVMVAVAQTSFWNFIPLATQSLSILYFNSISVILIAGADEEEAVKPVQLHWLLLDRPIGRELNGLLTGRVEPYP
ncbi:unnamed protein product [Prunus armeniaca]|uniref:Uncharacterized protein n=1 Tax=Prunus armeniaca TaxID=36596 RepID=A0A6J5TY66_PRUAR|nr:unnamed protein product [Prunus armeniaca]